MRDKILNIDIELYNFFCELKNDKERIIQKIYAVQRTLDLESEQYIMLDKICDRLETEIESLKKLIKDRDKIT